MRVIYNTCYVDPWVKVAQKLKDEYGYNPVYWIGYEDDNSAVLAPQYFPTIIYHHYYDAWKGVFPQAVRDMLSERFIDIDDIKHFAPYELQAIKMMDRMDADRYSFSFSERQRHYRKMLKSWSACLDLLKPDLVISAAIPHRVFDYILYTLCKCNNIKYVTYCNTAFLGKIIPIRQVNTIGSFFNEEYEKAKKQIKDGHFELDNIDVGIRSQYDKLQKEYLLPHYEVENDKMHAASDGFIPLLKKFTSDLLAHNNGGIISNAKLLWRGFPTYLKQKHKSIENSHLGIFQYSLMKLKSIQYKRYLKTYYNSLVENPDLQRPYVVFYLHYQPEATTSPAGDIFVDQLLCIEVLCKHLPANYSVYVKEHPGQFRSHNEGHTARIKEFYDDLKDYKQVRIMPLDFDSFTLTNNAKAVATVTGTAGWEGLVQGKPVIIFGLAWYENFAGVLRITDEKSAAKISRFIDNYVYDENDLLAYLNVVSKESIYAYHYRGRKEGLGMEEKQCVDNLTFSIIDMVNND